MFVSEEEWRESSFDDQWVARCPIALPLGKRLVQPRAGHFMLPSWSCHEVGHGVVFGAIARVVHDGQKEDGSAAG